MDLKRSNALSKGSIICSSLWLPKNPLQKCLELELLKSNLSQYQAFDFNSQTKYNGNPHKFEHYIHFPFEFGNFEPSNLNKLLICGFIEKTPMSPSIIYKRLYDEKLFEKIKNMIPTSTIYYVTISGDKKVKLKQLNNGEKIFKNNSKQILNPHLV